MGELEKLGSKYKLALRIVKDSRFERLPCMHKGTYADDCLVQRVTQHKCYIVATCDKVKYSHQILVYAKRVKAGNAN
jgi:U3 small nucleolar RNA-associated protein 24